LHTLDLVSCGLERLHTVISRPIGLGGTRNAGVDSDYGDAHSGNDGPARVGHGPYDGPLIVCLCEAERVGKKHQEQSHATLRFHGLHLRGRAPREQEALPAAGRRQSTVCASVSLSFLECQAVFLFAGNLPRLGNTTPLGSRSKTQGSHKSFAVETCCRVDVSVLLVTVFGGRNRSGSGFLQNSIRGEDSSVVKLGRHRIGRPARQAVIAHQFDVSDVPRLSSVGTETGPVPPGVVSVAIGAEDLAASEYEQVSRIAPHACTDRCGPRSALVVRVRFIKIDVLPFLLLPIRVTNHGENAARRELQQSGLIKAVFSG